MFFIGLASDLQDVDKKTHRPTKLISQGKQVGYFYDKHGRVKTKTLVPIDKNGNEIPQSTHNLVGYRESLQLFYSPNHELIKSITIKDEGLKVVKTVTHYYYDAFGRRIGKSSSTQKSSKLNQRGELVKFPSNLSSLNTTDRPQRKNTLMLWDGNRQIQEITDDFTFTTVYEQNSFVPVARIVERQPHLLKQAKLDEQTEWAKYENMTLSPKAKANIHHKAHTGLRIYHYHTDHLGTPQELTNDRGEVVWLNYQMAWGGSFSQLNNVYNLDGLDVSADELQPFRFQGQFFDGETGLHYNRFRYYDSDVGMFISRDPIGLLGGNNVFQYAPNPIGWIDPWGLNPCNDAKGNTNNSRRSAFQKAKKDANVPKSQQPDKIFDDKNNRRQQYRYVKMTDKNGKSILDKNGNTIWTREYQFTTKDNSKVIIQDHSAGHKFPDGKNEEGSHFNVRPIHDTRNGKVSGTKAHYEFN